MTLAKSARRDSRQDATPPADTGIGAEEDAWAGEDDAFLGEGRWLPRRRLARIPGAPENSSAVSVFRVVLACALVGALFWALVGYGLYVLIGLEPSGGGSWE
jgi:hypothetical protein